MLHVPQMLFEICWKIKKLPVLLQYLTQFIETKSIPGKVYENSGLVHFTFQDIGRVSAPNLVPRHCLRYLETTLVIEEDDWAQNLREVL